MICPRCGGSAWAITERYFAKCSVRLRECNCCGVYFILEFLEKEGPG